MEVINFLSEAANQNLLLAGVPESLSLLIFGVSLILLTIGLRWFLAKRRDEKTEELDKTVG